MQKKCKYCGKEFDATKSKRLYLPIKAKEMAINVLEEVQQYRAIGTPKKIKDLLEKAAEEIENLYGRETQLSEEIRKSLDS